MTSHTLPKSACSSCRCSQLLPPPPIARRSPPPLQCAAQADALYSARQPSAKQPGRRQLLLGGLLLAGAAAAAPACQADIETAAASTSEANGLVAFANPSQGYTLLRPAAWEQVDKAGADSLFRDPAKKSSNVGVTVYPVRISSLEQFGDLQAVGERLLAAEKAKDSTLSVAMVTQSARSSAGGAPTYDFEYELESTRGRKRILSTVTIAGGKLFISNGNITCGKESCEGVQTQLPMLRRVTQSLAVAS